MMNRIFIQFSLYVSFLFFLISCSTTQQLVINNAITKSCDLKEKLNDTIVVKGIYSKCVEYESFKLIRKDDCVDSFNMKLNFDQQSNEEKDLAELKKLAGCNQSIELCLKGIVRKENQTYGHLGSNNALFEVIDFIKIGRVTTIKP